ncbi:GRAM domain-containing protein [Cavenderia fasciculata]|uniref:Synaptosomal-associated protein 47 n=1 Tax=Cavenderia fasciculata TaxID=261658 RepID=F4Q5W5_CACFS|nr:GRAM domain-containing protein [Cavenderia fasciculata]EGG17374.1 GRAM domain-containing protein [Cavenderia fasciculata]|eukprot:XP_004355858.1 GRAM domain-containing protein [Cavenderia fasciculata]
MSSPDDKASALKTKSDLVRRTFNYPDTESVIQDYSCSLKRGILIPGKIYISANFVSFIPSLGESNESISFRKVNEIKKDSTMFIQNTIVFSTAESNVAFASLLRRDETYNLIHHLWKHPPMTYEPNSEEDERMRQFTNSLNSSGSGISNSSNGGRVFGNGGSNNSSSSNIGGGAQGFNGGNNNNNNGQIQQQRTKVDTESTKQALRIAYETRETGISTMNELSYQAELIDNIERNVENIHGNLDRSDRLLKGMESWGGMISNAMGKDETANRERPSHDQVDRSLKVRPRDDPAVDIDILEKLPNDFLQAGYMQFTADKFVVLDGNKKATMNGTYGYDQVEHIVIRARHQHIDFRLTNKNRIRLCSSYIQNIVNEFVLRSNFKLGKAAKVIFEPGVKQFAYGNPTIKFIPSVGRQQQNQALFGRTNTSGVSHVVKNASEDVREALMQQDKDLDEISALLGDIHGIASTIGNEADRQSEQLDRVTGRVDYANDRLQSNNKRIQKML